MRMGAFLSTPLSSSATGVRFTRTPLQRGKCGSARSRAPHGLGVEVEQSAGRVVGLLQHLVARAAVERPELLGRIERRRVQRLAAPSSATFSSMRRLWNPSRSPGGNGAVDQKPTLTYSRSGSKAYRYHTCDGS